MRKSFEKFLARQEALARQYGEAYEDTLVKDIIAKYDLHKDGSFVEGTNRISF